MRRENIAQQTFSCERDKVVVIHSKTDSNDKFGPTHTPFSPIA